MKVFQYIPLAAMLAFGACNPNLKQNEYQKPNGADFTNFVAIGNSLTSGYQDGALTRVGQENAFPKMIFDQMNDMYGGQLSFKIPYLPSTVSSNGGASPRMILGYKSDCLGTTSLSPVPDMNFSTTLDNVSADGPYNLVGAPGIKAVESNYPLISSLNPFLKRFCQAPGSSTLLSEALRSNPTFYTLWLGNNDVLGYATGGATGKIDPPIPFPSDLSSVAMVSGSINIVLDSLSKRGAKGVIANVPDVSSVPYFTTIPWNGAVLDQTTADFLNTVYTGLGLGAVIHFNAGPNGFVIVDSTSASTGYLRQATANDYILLSTPGDSLKCGQWGTNPLKPLKDAYVLDAAEVAVIKDHITQYNANIKTLAETYGIGLVDMNTYLKTLKSGLVYNNIKMNANYISGGAFSLDGVHPNTRGYAMVANEFIRVINATYKCNLRYVDVTKYDGIVFPK